MQAYAAKRGGDNAYQHSMLHLRNAEFDSSIVAALNDDIGVHSVLHCVVVCCSVLQCVASAQRQV